MLPKFTGKKYEEALKRADLHARYELTRHWRRIVVV